MSVLSHDLYWRNKTYKLRRSIFALFVCRGQRHVLEKCDCKVVVLFIAPARVSYRDEFLMSYRVYMMMGHFISRLFEGTLYVLIKYTNDSKSQQLRMRYTFQSTGRQMADQFQTSTYMIPLRDFVPE